MQFDPSLTALRALRSLAQTGSVSLTAVELGLTQSAVSRSIISLEAAVGLTLVRRTVRPMELTQEGQIVASHANEINQTIVCLGERLSDIRRNKTGSVRIGSFGASASTQILPSLIKAFTKQFPSISVSILEANDGQTLLNLQRGVVDIGLLADPGEEYESIPLANDQLVALVSKNSVLASYKVIKPKDLATQAFIMTLGGSERFIAQWFSQAGVEPQVTHRVLQAHSILALVRAQLGNAIVAGLSLPKTTTGVSQIPLYKATTNRLVLARKYHTPNSNAAELFWKFVADTV